MKSRLSKKIFLYKNMSGEMDDYCSNLRQGQHKVTTKFKIYEKSLPHRIR